MSELGTILIVDDSDTHRVVIAGELEKIGYATLAVDSGAKAIQTVAAEAVGPAVVWWSGGRVVSKRKT